MTGILFLIYGTGLFITKEKLRTTSVPIGRQLAMIIFWPFVWLAIAFDSVILEEW